MKLGINFTAWPEMLAWPYLMLQGWLPYRDIGIVHNPLLLLDLAIFYKIFGVGILQLKIYTWILIIFNACLTYFVASKFWNKKVAVLSSILYLVLCIIYQGNGLWFDLALTPFALLLYLFIRQKNYLWAGIIFAFGFLTKQTFIWFAISIFYLFIKNWKLKIRNFIKFLTGGMIIFISFLIVLVWLGLVLDYYKWAIEFGILFLPRVDGQILFPSLKQLIFALLPFGIFVLNKNLFIWAVVGAMGVYPRWELFHFQPALPFIAIAFSIFVFSKRNLIFKIFVMIFTVCFMLYGLWKQIGEETRFFESDVQKISSFIINHKPQAMSLYIINYWDNIYALTNTLPPKPLIPYIPWYLDYNNNLELIISNLKLNMPEMIVIGERENNNFSLYEFVERYYNCRIFEKSVEVCIKN